MPIILLSEKPVFPARPPSRWGKEEFFRSELWVKRVACAMLFAASLPRDSASESGWMRGDFHRADFQNVPGFSSNGCTGAYQGNARTVRCTLTGVLVGCFAREQMALVHPVSHIGPPTVDGQHLFALI